MDFSNTRISLDRRLTDYSKVQWLVGTALRNRPWHINRKRIRNLKYLNAGCGPNIHQDFVNLDWSWRPGIDICWDLTRGVPLQDNSLLGVFSEHCLEHITLEECRQVLAEFRRILLSGGTIRLSIPDGGLYLETYAQREGIISPGQGEREFPYEQADRASDLYTPIVSVNRIARDSGHQYLYDFSLLKLVLEKAGFIEVERVAYRQGRDAELFLDSEHRAEESLYVEARAP